MSEVNNKQSVFYVDLIRYRSELKKLVEAEPKGHFALGRNKAIEGVGSLPVSWLKNDILECEEIIFENKDNPSFTEDDILFRKGYADGLQAAIDTQIMCSVTEAKRSAAILDPFGVILKASAHKERFNTVVKENGVEVKLRHFETLSDAESSAEEYDAYYILLEGVADKEDDRVCNLISELSDKRNKEVELLFFSLDLEKRIFEKIFMRTHSPEKWNNG